MTRARFPLSVLALALLAGAQTFRHLHWNFDDSYIIFRIVRNLLQGEGWTFNPGEVHNASTSVLNTVMVALASIGGADVPIAAHVLEGCWLAVSGIAVAWLFRRRFGDAVGLAAGAALVGLLAENLTWGLETHLFFCLLTLFLVVESAGRNSWPIIGLLTLARPDAMLIAGLRWLRAFVNDRSLSVSGVLQFLLVLSPWVVFSVLHFHQVFPDTLSNKIWQGSSGYWGRGPVYLKGLARHLLDAGWLVQAAYVLAAPGLWLLVRDRSVMLYAVGFVALQQTAYIVLNVPGYHWYFSIMDGVVVMMASYAIGSAVTAGERMVTEPRRRHMAGAVAYVAVLAVTGVYVRAAVVGEQTRDGRDEAYQRTASILKANGIPSGPVATVEVGTFGYYLDDYPMVDLIGLTSTNPEFITGANNDLFFANAPPTVLFHSPVWLFEQSLYDDIRFKLMYGPPTLIPDPAIPMQYFLLTPGARVPSSEDVSAYVEQHYQPFVAATAGPIAEARGSSELACTLDQLNGQLAGTRALRTSGPSLGISGWAADRGAAVGEPEFYALLTSGTTRFALKATTVKRPDVAAHLNDARFEMSGFDAQGHVMNVPPGPYRLGVARRRGEMFVYCEFPNPFSVGASPR